MSKNSDLIRLWVRVIPPLICLLISFPLHPIVDSFFELDLLNPGNSSVIKLFGKIKDHLGWVEFLFSALFTIIGGFISFCVDRIYFMSCDISDLGESYRDVVVKMEKLRLIYEDLEGRHNLIQKEVDHGRVLVLGCIPNVDLAQADDTYITHLGDDYCVMSTLMMDKAEEYLTSATYMSFLVDKKLPSGGYFRLVIAREPKHWDGLSTYGTISNQLDYKTIILPLTTWRTTCKETLGDLLDENVFNGLVQLVERNVELGIASQNVNSDGGFKNLLNTNLKGTKYCGRIEKPKERQVADGGNTIDMFLKENLSVLNGIPEESIRAFWKLMALLWLYRWTPSTEGKDFLPDSIASRFRCNYDTLELKIRAIPWNYS